MRSPHSLRHGLLVLSVGLIALPVWASDDCDAPLDRWQTREAVREMAAAQGWQIQRLKIDDGCYEIRGTDAQGRTFKAKIDPETLKVLKMKQYDHQPSGKPDRGRRFGGRNSQQSRDEESNGLRREVDCRGEVHRWQDGEEHASDLRRPPLH